MGGTPSTPQFEVVDPQFEVVDPAPLTMNQKRGSFSGAAIPPRQAASSPLDALPPADPEKADKYIQWINDPTKAGQPVPADLAAAGANARARGEAIRKAAQATLPPYDWQRGIIGGLTDVFTGGGMPSNESAPPLGESMAKGVRELETPGKRGTGALRVAATLGGTCHRPGVATPYLSRVPPT